MGRKVEFGISLQSAIDPIAFARDAEELGYSYVFCGEHLFFHGPTMNAFMTLAAAAGVTRSVGLVSAVTLLPLYPPAIAAKLASSLDVLSQGRFNLGVGIGGEYPPEFEAAGVAVGERAKRTDDALEVIDRLMRGDVVDFHSSFSSIPGLKLEPGPLQTPRVPFWIAGRRERALVRVATFADVWLPYMVAPQHVSDGIATLGSIAKESGTGGWAGRTAVHLFTAVDSDGSAAREMATRTMGQNYQQDMQRAASRYFLAGTPAECVARLEEYVAAGMDVAMLRLACPRGRAPEMARLIAEEVMPAFG